MSQNSPELPNRENRSSTDLLTCSDIRRCNIGTAKHAGTSTVASIEEDTKEIIVVALLHCWSYENMFGS